MARFDNCHLAVFGRIHRRTRGGLSSTGGRWADERGGL